MHYQTIELRIPVFFGCLGALFLCTLLAVRPLEPVQSVKESTEFIFEAAEESPAVLRPAQLFARTQLTEENFILTKYRQPDAQDRVIDFFKEICPTPGITEVILANAETFNIPPALAFALAWEESRFNPRAVNTGNRNGSIDRGLFQLNNFSFPRMDLQSFFDPQINAYYGMNHLRYCLDTGGTEIAALAMYNAGANRVRNDGTPKTTLNYVGRILENRQRIETLFLEKETRFQTELAQRIAIETESEPERPRLSLLKPLGMR